MVAAGEICPLCGAPLHPEQDWCLNCGAAARTRLAASPNWKVPLSVLAVVIALSLGLLAAALVELAGNTTTGAPTSTTTITTPAAVKSTPTTAAPTATTPPTGIATAPSTPGGATAPNTTATAPTLTAPTGTPGAKTRKLSPAVEQLLGKFRHRTTK
jgi:hypothetical protein